MSVNRRCFLTAGATGLGTAMAGCLGGLGSDEAGASGGLRLESLDVAGSPGGVISIRPPERVVLLDFFATWCAPCKPEMANLRAARSRFPADRVFIVSITPETDVGAIERFWEEYRGNWPVVMDPDLAAFQEHDVTGIPTIIVLTPDESEVMRHRGLAGEEEIIDGIEAALDRAGMR